MLARNSSFPELSGLVLEYSGTSDKRHFEQRTPLYKGHFEMHQPTHVHCT